MRHAGRGARIEAATSAVLGAATRGERDRALARAAVEVRGAACAEVWRRASGAWRFVVAAGGRLEDAAARLRAVDAGAPSALAGASRVHDMGCGLALVVPPVAPVAPAGASTDGEDELDALLALAAVVDRADGEDGDGSRPAPLPER